jgi:hypothetical protein
MKWQPIETAPKNGGLILGCTDKGVVQIIKRNKHLNIWVDVTGAEAYRVMNYWMELPPPPEQSE